MLAHLKFNDMEVAALEEWRSKINDILEGNIGSRPVAMVGDFNILHVDTVFGTEMLVLEHQDIARLEETAQKVIDFIEQGQMLFDTLYEAGEIEVQDDYS